MVKRHTAEALRIAKAIRRKKYADGGAPWGNVYGNQSDPIFDQLQKDIAAQKSRPLPAIGSLQKNPVPSPVDVKPNVGGDAPVTGDKDAGLPYIPGGVEGGSSMDGGPGSVSGTTSGNTFGGNTYGETYGPANTGFGLLDNAINNPGATAINAAVSTVPGLGPLNTISGLFGGPNAGGLATGSYGNPTSMSGTSYSKGSDPSAPTSASKGQTSAPAAPAEAPLSTTSVATTSVAPTPGQFGDMYTGLPAPMAPTEPVAPTEDVSVSPTGVAIANTPAGFALAQQQTDQHALDAYDAAKADENAAKAGAQIGEQVGQALTSQTPSAPNPAGELGWTGWTGQAKSYSSDIQSPQIAATPPFATAEQLADVPADMIGPTDVGQSISNYSYGTLADQNQQVSDLGDAISAGLGDTALGSGLGDGTIGGETGSFGAGIGGFGGGFGDGSIGGETGSFGAGIGGETGSFGSNTGDTSSDSSDSNSDSGGTGGSDSSGDGGGGGGDSEKRGGLVRSKRHASNDMVKQALKVTDAYSRKSKLRPKKDGSVVKQAVVLASKLAKRQRGRP